MSADMMPRDVIQFVGSARKVGFDGDIVLALQPNTPERVMSYMKKYNTVLYNVTISCIKDKKSQSCSLYNSPKKYAVNVLRFYIYRWLATVYDPSTLILLSDFRDVFFQSNPFTYRAFEWAPPASQLVVFQEAHPNMVINRCQFNSKWISECYGADALKQIGHNTVICSGVTMGTRNAILAYVSNNN